MNVINCSEDMCDNTINKELLQKINPLEFYAKQVVEGFITGKHKSPFHGFSVEFAEHRQYNTGESTRHIDWKLFGKTDRLYTKRYEEETNLRCHILLDISSSMYFPVIKKPSFESPNKMVFSVYAAAAIMQLLKKQRDAIALSLFDEKIQFSSQTKSSNTHVDFLYSQLEKFLDKPSVNEKRNTDVVDALHNIAEMIHKRSLVVIFSDMFDDIDKQEEMFAALRHLKHNKHEVILFHVVDQEKEIDFDFSQRPYQFIDMESGEKIKLQPDEIKELYVSKLTDYKKQLQLKCGQYKIDFVEADINKGFEQILLPYLVKRSKLY